MKFTYRHLPLPEKALLSKEKNRPKHYYRQVLLLLCCCLFITVVTTSFRTEQRVTEQVKADLVQGMGTLEQQAAALTEALQLYGQRQIPAKQVQERFYQTKLAYKKVEFLLEYLDPEIAKHLNGAPLPRVLIEEQDYQTIAFREPLFRTFPPEGLQVLEELLFDEAVSPAVAPEALVLMTQVEENISWFSKNMLRQPLTDRQLVEGMREEVLRLMTMGITGFDAPAAGFALEFAEASLQPVLATAQYYRQSSPGQVQQHSAQAAELLQQAVQYLQQHPDFDTFDRLYFIREIADPAYAALTQLQHALLGQPSVVLAATKPVNDGVFSLFSPDFLQASYYAKQDRRQQEPQLISLGQTLFFDPVLSASNERSCASCHLPDKAFTDGQARSVAFNFEGTVLRNSPTLLNSVYSKAYFWDSRAQYLQDQVPDVVLKNEELHSNYEEVVLKLRQSSEYRKLFKKAFPESPGNNLNVNTINRAIAAYVQSLTALNSPFDQYMRRETQELSVSVKNGFNLFTGKAGCATCHFAPVFNGTVPPRYNESETEVLGVPVSTDFDNPKLDADIGRAGIIPAEAFRHSFKTPTVRNAALTAPYMHNGAFATLAEVVEFYDRGGGQGIGLDVPNQTLPDAPLNLTEQEKQDLIAFMEALTDTNTAASVPKRLPQFPSRSSLNNRPIGGSY